MMNRPVGLLLGLGLAFYAGSAFAQNEKVSLNRQNAKTIQVLNDIEKQTNYLLILINRTAFVGPYNLPQKFDCQKRKTACDKY